MADDEDVTAAEAAEAQGVWDDAKAAGDTLDDALEDDFATAFEEFAAVDDTEDEPAPNVEVRADEEEAEDEPAPGEESPDAEAAPEQEEDAAAEPEDIWADATPEQIAAFKAAQHLAMPRVSRT